TIFHTPIPWPTGTVSIQHGIYPNPAPATAKLLEGRKNFSVDEQFEIITPTGAAILAAWSEELDTRALRQEKVGYGAGTVDLKRANVLRGSLCTRASHQDVVTILQTNLDDFSPENLGYLIQKLMDEGALDVSVAPITMKKQRAGHALTLITNSNEKDRLATIIFRETNTLGIRVREENRLIQRRHVETVETSYGSVRIKVSEYGAKPEFEDCQRIAKDTGMSLNEVQDLAVSLWKEQENK
ncbi:MAG: LarC family nickel insertion protein, partial [Candidatus Lindowbacteria bacterium]|nr:LarC family nickel insertion protein [Candidatus Lindowbacteria bacterium]